MSKYVWAVQVRNNPPIAYTSNKWRYSLSIPGRYKYENDAEIAISTYKKAFPAYSTDLEYRTKQRKAKKLPTDYTYAAEYRSRPNASGQHGWRPEAGSSYHDYSKLTYGDALGWFDKRLVYSEKRLVRSDGKIINEESK